MNNRKVHRPYLHRVFYINEDGSQGDTLYDIRTKSKLRKAMIEHFYGDGDCQRIGFSLLNSPNKSRYEVLPYVNRLGNPSIVFTPLPEEDNEAVPPF